ncbi:MAG: HDOD domain-containing protein [Pseudomonadota bacterium]
MEEHSAQFFDSIKTPENLPSLPQILFRVIELCNNEETRIKDISEIINVDPSLSAKVMNMVNPCYYGSPERTTSMEQALMLLGKNAIKSIAIGASDIQASSKTTDRSIFRLKVFWRHSLLCAILSKLIAEKILYSFPDEAFLAGLLHDIGKLVLWTNFPIKYADNLSSSKFQQDLTLAAQEGRHGVTHCEVGAWLIRRWNLESFMADSILYHHESLDRIQDAFPLVQIIYVGNALCPETNQDKADKFEIAKNLFGLELSELEEITLQAAGAVHEIAQSLGIEIEPREGSDSAISEKDFKKQQDLIKQVKDIALHQGTLQSLLEARDEDSILKIVQRGLDVLFQVKHVLFFLYESERNILSGKSVLPNKQYDLISQVKISFQEGKSLLTNSLCQGKPLDSFSNSIKDKPTIIDEQIIRLIENDGILCLPMAAYDRHIGVIVIGLKDVHFSSFAAKKRHLMIFTKQAALALYTNYLRQGRAKVVQPERPCIASAIAHKVAHEVNTPLSIIKNYLAVLRNKLPEYESFQDEIRIINEEIDRVALIVHQLSDSSKHKVEANESLDLNALISNLKGIFQESLMIGPGINVHLKLDPHLPTVLIDKNRMKQILSNLIMNAVEAMPGGGNLNIGTRYVSNDIDAETTPSIDNKPGHVQITIADDGPGIVDTVKSRLFEPYVTSKGAGHAGLGLSIVYSNVKDLKGTITCESGNKKGTVFKIFFPITPNQ